LGAQACNSIRSITGEYSVPGIELFYGLPREYWGQSLAREAGRALIRAGFDTLKLQRITSVAFRENVRSANVMRRVGMRVGSHAASVDDVLGVNRHPHQSAQAERDEPIAETHESAV
jgi:hypothetical protein